ncbi:MAG: 5'/3'-nucleotidase SurE [Gammaproteobacteria bacterium]|nr:5'/3'-nucleotidase SurE [Gammaproteobacteria bacterium]
MQLLVSNDDGVHALGLSHLVRELEQYHQVTVIAPDRDLSGASNSLTLSRPVRVMPQDNGFFGIDGTPADCVHLGINGALDIAPDMVVSGINHGANLGDDVLYSGTVAAAMEGRYLDHHAVAVSLVGKAHFATAAKVVRKLLDNIQQLNLPPRCIINVNVPDLPYDRIKGVQVTRLGSRELGASAIDAQDPRGHQCYWIGPVGAIKNAEKGTDFHAIEHGYVSITPLSPDMACYGAFDSVSDWLRDTV